MVELEGAEASDVIRRLLRVIQTQFGMDVTFVVGAGEVEADARAPLRFEGRTHGTLCCTRRADHELTDADLAAVQVLADVAAEYLEESEHTRRLAWNRRRVIVDVLDAPTSMEMVFQPLRDLRDGRVLAVEALARFPGHGRGPQWFFQEAAAQGLGVEAELVAVGRAIEHLPDIPERVHLNVNVSAETLADRRFLRALDAVPAGRLVFEITEHAVIEDYGDVRRASAQLAELGIRMSIDDVGAGWSGLNRILECHPDQIKLDAAVIRDVHLEPLKQALVETLCGFARRASVDVVAEGIESQAEVSALRRLGVVTGQGYHLGRPGALEALFARGRVSPR